MSSCTLQLTESSASPLYPLEGLWVQEINTSSHTRLLSIQPDGGKYPFSYQLVDFYPKNMFLGARNVYIEKSEGHLDTSQHEVMMIQSKFQAGKYNVKVEKGLVWHGPEFGRLNIERKFSKVSSRDLLVFSKQGSELKGKDFHFKRAIATNQAGAFTLSRELGYVFQVDPESKEILFYTLSSLMAIANKNRFILKNKTKQIKIKLNSVYSGFVNASFLGNTAPKTGSIVVMPRFKIKKKFKRKIDRVEVLRRLKNGRHVSREDIIRIIESKIK